MASYVIVTRNRNTEAISVYGPYRELSKATRIMLHMQAGRSRKVALPSAHTFAIRTLTKYDPSI